MPVEVLFELCKVYRPLSFFVSYIQVEYGLKELEAHWAGFFDTCSYERIKFNSFAEMCDKFMEFCSEIIGQEPVYSWHQL